MVGQAIAHSRPADDASGRVEDEEAPIRTGPVVVGRQLLGQREGVVLQVPLEFLDVRPVALAAPELVPGLKEVFRTSNLIKYAAHIRI